MPDAATIAEASKIDSFAGYPLSTYMWGILGSAVSMRFVPQLGFMAKMTAVAAGTAVAVAGTPLVKLAFNIVDEQALYGVSFFIGVFGLSLAASIFDTMRNTKWGRILERRLGGIQDGPSDSEGDRVP